MLADLTQDRLEGGAGNDTCMAMANDIPLGGGGGGYYIVRSADNTIIETTTAAIDTGKSHVPFIAGPNLGGRQPVWSAALLSAWSRKARAI